LSRFVACPSEAAVGRPPENVIVFARIGTAARYVKFRLPPAASVPTGHVTWV
jgi:hypothetical protein